MQVTAPVRSCGISNDCRHVLSVLGNGFIFRFETIRSEGDQVWNKQNGEVCFDIVNGDYKVACCLCRPLLKQKLYLKPKVIVINSRWKRTDENTYPWPLYQNLTAVEQL